MKDSKNISKGKIGENLASNYLRSKGFKIIEKNFKSGKSGEIDIICVKDNDLIFVEVKLRESILKGTPEDSITEIKKERIYNCAKYFIFKHPEFVDYNFRFDFIGITKRKTLFKKFSIKHIENVFSFDEF